MQLDLPALVGHERQLVPNAVMALPSMLSYEERALLHWAARVGSTASGTIIDAGCFLGGSTLPLALGLLAREPGPGRPDATQIHSFDLFRVGDERERVYFDESVEFAIGASIRPLYEHNIAAVRNRVVVHEGDINQLTSWPEPISVLFVDIAKSWTTNETVSQRFFPQLQPHAIVIQQDLVHFGHPWCALTMELLTDYFDFLGFVPFSSAVYRVTKPLPADRIPSDLLTRLRADDSLALIDRCARRVGEPFAGYVRLAGASVLGYYGEPARAREIIASVADTYNDETLPWISEHLAVSSEFIDRVPAR